MKNICFPVALALGLLLVGVSCAQVAVPPPTPAGTATPVATPPAPTPLATPVPATPSPTPVATPEVTPTKTPTAEPAPVKTETPTPVPTPTAQPASNSQGQVAAKELVNRIVDTTDHAKLWTTRWPTFESYNADQSRLMPPKPPEGYALSSEYLRGFYDVVIAYAKQLAATTPLPTPVPTVATPVPMPTAAPPPLLGSTELPNEFYGTIRLYKKADKSDAYPAAAGAKVYVVVGGTLWETQPATKGQGYDYAVVVRPRSSAETKMDFYVDGVKADQSATFVKGSVDKLDLTVHVQ